MKERNKLGLEILEFELETRLAEQRSADAHLAQQTHLHIEQPHVGRIEAFATNCAH